MNKWVSLARVALAILCVMGLVFASPSLWAESARFEPPHGKTLLFIGQNLEDIQAYVKAAQVIPAGFMMYTSVNQTEGLDQPFNQGDGTQFGQQLVHDYPQTALQIGLWMVNDCAKIAHGDMDRRIDRLASWIQATQRPVWLRVGYEFDHPANHYPPQEYIAAYRHLVDRFRTRGVKNVAYVWHSSASAMTRPLADWYPGDDYVDWVGLSYFDQPHSLMQPVIQFAQEHHKPIMIAESSPWKVQTLYPNSWNLWFASLFKFIQANNIQALCYISCNWNATRQFGSHNWGDTRLQSNPDLLHRWLQETSQDRYLQSSPTLFQQLNFHSNQ